MEDQLVYIFMGTAYTIIFLCQVCLALCKLPSFLDIWHAAATDSSSCLGLLVSMPL